MDKSAFPYQNRVAAGRTEMTERKYQHVTKISTEALDEIMENHVLQLLDLRSTANEKQGLLSRALEDATSMIQYRPASALGYLRSSRVHLASGQPSLAVNSYKRGLEIVPESHPQYHLLQDEYEMAMSRAQYRFDIVGNLPLELLPMILDHMDQESVWICLTISRKWCDQVSRCGPYWDTIIIKYTGTQLDEIVCHAFPLFQDRIQRLELGDFPSMLKDLRYLYLHHFKCGVFKNIRKLSLKEGFYDNMEPEEFAIALWQMRHTLRVLKLEFTAHKSYRLLSVFGTCPNIESLTYATAGDIVFTSQNEDYASRVTCKKLSNLELHYNPITAALSSRALWSHLAVCPSLRILVLRTSTLQSLSDTRHYATFTNYCPRLKIIEVHCGNRMVDGMVLHSDGFQQYSNDEEGVVCLSVEFGEKATFFEAKELINTQSRSLRRLYITHTDDDDDDEDDDEDEQCTEIRDLSCTYTKLSTLQYVGLGSYYNPYENAAFTTENFVRTIIQNASNLTYLSLLYVSAHVRFRTVVEKAVKTKVQTLKLKEISFQRTGSEWYKSFLSSLDRVETLEIQNCWFLNDNVIPFLARSESVRQLTLTECTRITSDGLAELFKEIALRPSHQLAVIHLSRISAPVTKVAIGFMLKNKNLRTLRITGDKSIDIESVNYLVSQAPYSNLKTIEILDCFSSVVAPECFRYVARLKKEGITLFFKQIHDNI